MTAYAQSDVNVFGMPEAQFALLGDTFPHGEYQKNAIIPVYFTVVYRPSESYNSGSTTITWFVERD